MIFEQFPKRYFSFRQKVIQSLGELLLLVIVSSFVGFILRRGSSPKKIRRGMKIEFQQSLPL